MNPSQAKSIPELVELAAKLYGDKISIEDQDKSLSFKQLHEESDRVFYSLLSSGINQGDRVGIWAPNQYEWILAAIGILKVGAILVPVNTRLKGEEAGYILEKSSVKLLFTMENFLGINYAEILDMYLLKDRLEVLNTIEPFIGQYFSKKYVQKQVFRMSDDEIESMQKDIDSEPEPEEDEDL